MNHWISMEDFASLASMSPQRARKICSETIEQRRKTWHNAPLIIRKARGIGGKSGWSYQVLVESLPLNLQLA